MININNLTDKDVGRYVIYNSFNKKERGRIKSWNDKLIFVVYNCAEEWNNYKNYTASATNPEDLEFKR